MAWSHDLLFQQTFAATKGRNRFAAGRFESRGEVFSVSGSAESASTATVNGLDGDRVTNCVGNVESVFNVFDRTA